MLHFGVISLMPDMFASMNYGVVGRAIEQGLARIDCWNLREWAMNAHGQVDDKPYGGGPGMVLMYEPLQAAIIHARAHMPETCKTVYLSPQGKQIKQSDLKHIADRHQPLLFLAGRYEGIDERLIGHYVDEEWSLGDFVLSGGELAAMVFMDAMIRLLPGSLGHQASAQQDSFMHGLLDYPHYTRPADINGESVPDVLLSGCHREIERWRRKQALGRTWLKRPDLLKELSLNAADEKLLIEFKCEHGDSH
jgi:tRNA (guanine37-N1)-methyltransferase